MDENKTIKSEEFEIDIRRVISALIKRFLLIAITSLLRAVIALGYTFFFVTPLYKSSAKFYVNNSTINLSNVSASITASDISASRGLVDVYIIILNTRESINAVIDYAGIDRSYNYVKGRINAQAVNDTEIFQVEVTSSDPEEAEKIVNAIAYVLPKRISSIIEGSSAKVVEHGVVPTMRSSPSYTNNVILGFAIGFILSAGYVALREIFDFTIRESEDITQICKYPILTEVPDMTAPSKGGYYSKSKKKYYNRSSSEDAKKQKELFGEGISFAASEAYKLLRTKVQFSFADDKACHVLCTTSALAGEGKSLSSINLACSFAQLDKKVLLVDCDLRRPSIAAKMKIQRAPGLSDYLTRNVDEGEIIQNYALSSGSSFDVVPAGRIPPNPMELLGSVRMENVIERYKEVYDYIILDLPPIEEVGDALVVAKIADGVMLVVRQNHGNRLAIENTLRQLEFVEAKILGVIFNATSEDGGRYYSYGKKYYGYRYSGNYYRQRPYENSYEQSADEAKKEFEKKAAEERTVRKRSHKDSAENNHVY